MMESSPVKSAKVIAEKVLPQGGNFSPGAPVRVYAKIRQPLRFMKIYLLLALLPCLSPLAAQEKTPAAPLPPTALDALGTFKAKTGRDKLTGLVEMRGANGVPTPLIWNVVVLDSRSPTKLEEFTVRGSRVEDRGPNRDYYPDREPAGVFDMSKVEVDCAGAFRIADREAGAAQVGFDVIDYRLRCREFSDEPVWILTLRTTTGELKGTVTLSAKSGKTLRTVWQRPGPKGRVIPDDSALPAEFRPPPPAPPPQPVLPDPFPEKPALPDPAAPAPAPPSSPLPPPEPEGKLPPPPPLPPLGTPPAPPRIVPD